MTRVSLTRSLHILLHLSVYTHPVHLFKDTKSYLDSWDVLHTIGIEPELSHSLGTVEVCESHSDYVLVILDSHPLVV